MATIYEAIKVLVDDDSCGTKKKISKGYSKASLNSLGDLQWDNGTPVYINASTIDGWEICEQDSKTLNLARRLQFLDDYIKVNDGSPLIEYSDGDVDNEYEYAIEQLDEVIDAIGEEQWVAVVRNFGWRNLRGSHYFRADTGREFISSVLPATYCTWKIYIDKQDDQYLIQIQNSHHDSPCGDEWYQIMPSSPCVHCSNPTIIVNEHLEFIKDGEKSKDGDYFECNSCAKQRRAQCH